MTRAAESIVVAARPRPQCAGRAGVHPSRSLRATTSPATSASSRSLLNANARSRISASVTLTCSWTETMAAALCTTKWKSAPSCSSPPPCPGAPRPGPPAPSGPPRRPPPARQHADRRSADRAGPGTSSAPPGAPCRPATGTRTPPTPPPAPPPGRKPATGGPPDRPGPARPPPCPAGRHPRTGPRPACTAAPRSPGSPPSLVHNDPRGISPDISMTPAPVTPAIPGQTPHSRAEDHPCPRRTTPPESGQACHPASASLPPPADTRPTAPSPMTIGHLQPPSPAGTKPSGRERAQRPPGPGPITDATPPATPGASACHPDIAQTGMICARAADRDAYPTPIYIRQLSLRRDLGPFVRRRHAP